MIIAAEVLATRKTLTLYYILYYKVRGVGVAEHLAGR